MRQEEGKLLLVNSWEVFLFYIIFFILCNILKITIKIVLL